MDLLSTGRQVISKQIHALTQLDAVLTESFADAVNLIVQCRGKTIVSGMGKSGLIGQKIASTLSSTGSPSFFVHPGEASHGDLGMITTHDVVIAISKSGESSEIFDLLHYCKRNGVPLIAITSNPNSTLASAGTVLLQLPDVPEACLTGNAPTTSATMTLVLGDALAVACSSIRNFKESDFHNFHPGGKLGKQFIRVSHIMRELTPSVNPEDSLQMAIERMTQAKLGIVAVLEDDKLIGVITDGDIRRGFFKSTDIRGIMTDTPITTHPDHLAVEVLHRMNQHGILCVPVLEGEVLIGFLHIHDCLKAGL